MQSLNKKFLQSVGNLLLPDILTVLLKTVRIRIINKDTVAKLQENKQNFVAAFWHGKMAIGWYLFRNFNFAALISKSKDGEMLTKVLDKWKYKVVRGSSHKGGKESLNILLKMVSENYSIAITPDGPTGPPKQLKPGAVIIPKKTGIPLVLTGIAMQNKMSFNSWDGFQLPKPFSKIFIKYSEPIYFESTLDYDETNEILKCTEERLNALNDEMEKLC